LTVLASSPASRLLQGAVADTGFVNDSKYCRSEHARENPESTAGIQNARVFVNDHRERARSYKFGDSLARAVCSFL
jgi:hypothetical protein